MAITYTDNGGGAPNGSDKEFTYTFPVIQTEDVKVALNGVTQATTKYTVDNVSNPTKITFNTTNPTSGVQVTSGTNQGAPLTGVRVRVYRETTVGKANGDEDPKAVFAAGSSIRAIDLNANHEQSLMAIHELQDRPIETEDLQDLSITSDKIADGTIQEVDIANSAVTSNKIADNAVTTTEILNGAVTRAKLEADAIDGTKLADNAVNSEHYTDGSIDREHLEADIIDSTKLADNAVNSEHYVDGSIDHVHLANDIIDGDNIQDDVVNSEHIAAGALDNEHYAAGSITSDKLNGATVVTNSEQAAHSVNDTSFFTTAAAEARYFNASTGETIKNGQNFPDNDTTIATTAAINDRIIDLVDGVGGFVPVPNETSFPAANPDINNPPAGGTIVSIKAASEALPNGSTATLSGTTLTISNGRGTNSAVILTGAPSTIPSGFGFLVETTSTDHTYAFHRLVPKATEVTTVAGKATEIGRLGTADAVADMAILGTADVVSDLNTLGTADVVSDMNALAVSDVISDMNTLAVTSVINNMDTVATNVANVNLTGGSIANVNTTAGSIANVNTVAGSIANVNTTAGSISNVNTTAGSISNVNTVASNMANVNNFADRYQIAANNPPTDGGGNALAPGDLYFNTSANELKVYNGSAWQGGVTATGTFAATTGNTFTGDNRYNDGVKALFGTGSDLQIYHASNNNVISSQANSGNGILKLLVDNRVDFKNFADNETIAKFTESGSCELYFNNSKKLETTATGILLEDSSAKTTAPLQIRNLNSSGVCTNPKLEFYGRTVIGQGSIPYIQSVHGTEAGGSNAANDGGLEFHTRNGGSGTDTMCMHMSHDANVGIKTITPAHALDVVGDIQIQGITPQLFLTDTDHNSDWSVENADGIFTIKDQTNNQSRLTIDTGGQVNISNKVFLNGGLDTDGDVQFNTGTTNSNILFDASAGALEFTDGNKAVFGTDSDLLIYHDATANVNKIQSQKSNETKVKNYYVYTNNHGTAHESIMAYGNGAVELTHAGTKKFETTSSGVTVTGQVTSNTINISSNAPRLIFTDANNNPDFEISGNSGALSFIDSTNSANRLIIQSDGSVDVYGSLDANGGLDVTGNITVTGTVDGVDIAALSSTVSGLTTDVVSDTSPQLGGNLDVNTKNIVFGDSSGASDDRLTFGAGTDLQIYHQNSNNTSYLYNTSTDLTLMTGGTNVNIKNDGGEFFAKFVNNGAAELYHNNVKQLETESGGIIVTDNDSTAYVKLITTSGNAGYLYGSGATDTGLLDGNGSWLLRGIKDGKLELYYDASVVLETTSTGIFVDRKISCKEITRTADVGTYGTMGGIHFSTKSVLPMDSNGTVINNDIELGSSTYRWKNIYTNDLHLSNEGHSNDIDDTWGNWTIQEGESDLFLKNNRSGKKYKFNLTEVS